MCGNGLPCDVRPHWLGFRGGCTLEVLLYFNSECINVLSTMVYRFCYQWEIYKIYLFKPLSISAGTPYAGGYFKIKLVLGKNFPREPPKGFFITKIFHPNVAKNGEICVNTLKRDWKTDYGLKHILLVSIMFGSQVTSILFMFKLYMF